MEASEMAKRLRRASGCAEFEFKGWTLLVLDYEQCDDVPAERQVKVSPDPANPDEGAFWLDVAGAPEAELAQLQFLSRLTGAAVPEDGGGRCRD